MKHLIKPILAIVVLINLTGKSFAGAGWSGSATITSIYSLNENIALIKLSNFTNPHGCSVDSQGDIVINPTTQKVWFTMLYSAYMANKNVNIYVTPNCTAQWASTYASAGHVRLF